MRQWIAFVLLGVVGLGVFIGLQGKAFPHAAVDLQVTRQQALARAGDFLASQGFDLTGYDRAILFGSVQDATVYLQRNLADDQANAIQKELGIWHWSVRFFKTLEKREYRVAIDPGDGRVLSFTQYLAEDAAGERLAQEKARAVAEAFLGARGIDLKDYKLIEQSSKEEKARTDHTFRWERQGWQVGEARREAAAVVQGGSVGSFNGYRLHVPEAFTREFERQSSYGDLYAILALVMSAVFAVASLVWFIILLRAGDINWRNPVGAAITVAVLVLLNGVNALNALKLAYQTQIPYAVFAATVAIAGVIGVVFQAAFIALPGAAGEGLSRRVFGERAPTLSNFSLKALTGPRFAASALRGYCVAAMMLGYVVLFYFLGRRYLGVWMPGEPGYDNTLAGPLPWLAPLAISLLASLSEEFTFRFFAIPFTKRLVRWTPAAVVIPALIWAFAHSNYQVFPMYIRGIELTIVGTGLGLLYLFYDIETTIVAHYVYDALLIAGPLLASGSTYYLISGIVVVGLAAIPLLLAGVGWLRRRGRAAAAPSA